MRIDTDLTEQDRDAIAVYASTNNLTMKGAYTELLRSALWDRSIITNHDNGNVGLGFYGHDSGIYTNVQPEQLTEFEGYRTIYWPRKFALVEAGFDLSNQENTYPSLFGGEE